MKKKIVLTIIYICLVFTAVYAQQMDFKYYNDLSGNDGYAVAIYIPPNEECKKSSDFEYWYEFDNNGRRIYSKYSNGVEEWQVYDQYGNPFRTIVKRNGKLDNVRAHILEYHKNSKTLKKETMYTYTKTLCRECLYRFCKIF